MIMVGQDNLLTEAVKKCKARNWKKIGRCENFTYCFSFCAFDFIDTHMNCETPYCFWLVGGFFISPSFDRLKIFLNSFLFDKLFIHEYLSAVLQ